jgi:hypothetical protein
MTCCVTATPAVNMPLMRSFERPSKENSPPSESGRVNMLWKEMKGNSVVNE